MLAARDLSAQSDTGRIQGAVADTTGAAISSAAVTLTNKDTGRVFTRNSDSSGNFSFPALEPGRYEAAVSAPGFEGEAQAFSIEVSEVRDLKFKLAVGSVSTTAEVTDAAPLIESTTSSLGTVIQGRQVTELPLNGRNFTQLATLVPGVTRGAYGNGAQGTSGQAETNRYNDTGGASLQVNGLPPQANNFELDGLDNNDAKVNTIVVFPPVEGTRQFRVTTSVAPAEFGQAGGAIIQSALKSGSNQIHGSAFLFYRDQIFDASPNYFAPTQPNPPFHRLQFGGTLGGPIWKNRIFLFGDYSGLRVTQPLGLSYQTVPTALERTGDFSELLSAGSTITTHTPNQTITGCTTAPGPKGTIYDPTTCAAFAGNKILPSRLNQAAINYLNAFPLPNNGAAQGNLTLQNNYFTNPVQTQRYNDFDVRLDWTASTKDALFARYSYGQDILSKNSLFPNLPAGYAAGVNPTHPRSQAYGYTRILSQNIVNELRYGHLYEFYGYVNPDNSIPLSANLGIQNANRNALLGGGAAINGGYLAYTGDGGQYTVPQGYDEFVDNVSWSKGRHSMKFGTSIEQRRLSFFQGNNSKGLFDYSSASFTGFAISDMVAAFVNNYQIGVASSYFVQKAWKDGLFGEDDWKVNSRLTLNLGVRYDLLTQPYEVNNNQSTFDLSTLKLRVAGTGGLSRSIINTDRTSIVPRIGFAYDLSGKNTTILRGGYGIFHYLVYANLTNNPDFNGSQTYSSSPTNGGYRITFSGQSPTKDNNNLDATAPLPLPIFGQAVNRDNPVNSNLISTAFNRPPPTVQQFNLQLQQQINRNASITFAYVGTTARHQTQAYNVNGQPYNTVPNTKLYPQFGSINLTIPNGNTSYNGLQVFLNSRPSHGITYTAAYTWSHAIDNQGGATLGTGNNANFAINRGSSSADQRHVLTVTGLAELPFGRGKMFASNLPAVIDKVVGGWQVNTVISLQSGTPFDVTTGNYFYTSAAGVTAAPSGSITSRPDLIAPVRYVKRLQEWFDPSSFARPPVINSNGQQSVFIRQGTFGRDILVGPSFRNVDMSLFKKVPLWHEVYGEFRAEGYNLMNTPAFTNPNGSLDSCIYPSGSAATYTCPATPNGLLAASNFGQITGTRLHSERQVQLAFRFQF